MGYFCQYIDRSRHIYIYIVFSQQNDMPVSKSYSMLACESMGYMFYFRNPRSGFVKIRQTICYKRYEKLLFSSYGIPFCVVLLLSFSLSLSRPSFLVLVVMHDTLPEPSRDTCKRGHSRERGTSAMLDVHHMFPEALHSAPRTTVVGLRRKLSQPTYLPPSPILTIVWRG